MLNTPMDVLHQFPVRKSRKQKQAFRDAVQTYVSDLGYPVGIEKGSLGARNVVIGDPDKARFLVTAHYDTCAGMIVPNMVWPRNFMLYLIYQLLILAGFFAVTVLVILGVAFVSDDWDLAATAGIISYWVLLLSLMFGPANPNNANDNTSGVVTLLELARTIPREHRQDVCFVLFDLEEAGLIGSSSYAKAHKAALKGQIVLNMDCVGDGNEILLFPCKKLQRRPASMEMLAKVERSRGEKSVTLHRKGFFFYPSDQTNFPFGVAVAAFRKKKLMGLYYGRIHTRRDTILDETNVQLLREALIALICGAPKS